MIPELTELVSEELDFFSQAKKYEPNPVIPKTEDLPGLKIRDETRQFSIVTQRVDKLNSGKPIRPHYFTTIWDFEKQMEAKENKRVNSVFAHICTDSFQEALQNHYSSLQHLKNSGY